MAVRTEVNAYTVTRDKKNVFLKVCSLNEFDSKLSGSVDWRKTLDQQSGAVLATEMKNNTNKMARWTAQSLLSGVDEIRLGYVSRIFSQDSVKHAILKTQHHKPSMFAASLSIRTPNLWATLRKIISMIHEQEDGEYLLMKDPNEAKINLYLLPSGNDSE